MLGGALLASVVGPVAAMTPTPAFADAADVRVAQLEHEVQDLESVRAIRTLQRAYGYYIDRALWHEAAALFADDATIELGADGVYVGKARVLQYLLQLGHGRDGLSYGELREHLQLQPVVHIDADGEHAHGRWRDLAMLGEFGRSASWGDGVYENTYVRRNGVWMIQSLHLYVTFVAPYDKGWARLKPAGDWRSQAAKDLLPDRPPTVSYEPFPDSQVVPFHYLNPGGEGAEAARASATADMAVARNTVTRVGAVPGAHAEPPPSTATAVADPQLRSVVGAYEHRAQLLRDHDDIENLQGMYGYYFDKQLWDDVARLFSKDGSFEDGQRGVYVGPEHIRAALRLFGAQGPRQGQLNNYLQLQPVIHVADDGRHAQARCRGVLQLSVPHANGQWGEGTYENEYVKEGGVWKLSKLHFYLTALADYDLMWAKGSVPVAQPSTVLPPDRPPTDIYRSLPGVYLPPFHYVHPVTGQPIDARAPPDSILGRP